MQIPRLAATLGLAFTIAAVTATAGEQVHILPLPPLPIEGQPFTVFIFDRALMFPHDQPSVSLQWAAPPYKQWKSQVANAGDVILVSPTERLPAGEYWLGYWESSAPNYLDDPKSFVRFVVSRTGPIDVVEYFNPLLGEFFLASDLDEITRLDAGAKGTWVRTGESFRAFSPAEMPGFALPVCRYYGLPSAGLDAHFFSADPGECANVAGRWPRQWVLESPAVFGAVGDVGPEPCEASMVRLYRLFDGTTRHRYTIYEATRDRMLEQGWTLEAGRSDSESAGPYSMCVLAPE